MDSVAAALMRNPKQIADAFELLADRWPKWITAADFQTHREAILDDWQALKRLVDGNESLAADCLATSAVAGVLQDDGTLCEEDIEAAERRLQIACDADLLPNFQGYFGFIAEMWEIEAPQL
jgi:hypothetical protein